MEARTRTTGTVYRDEAAELMAAAAREAAGPQRASATGQPSQRHLDRCPPCRAAALRERGARRVLREQSRALTDTPLPPGLRTRCEALARQLVQMMGDKLFQGYRRANSAREAIFTRKVGHTQRGGRPILFDRFYAAQLGGKAVDLLVEGHNNAAATLQWSRSRGFHVSSFDANRFRDRWGHIHARLMHPSFYDPHLMKPSRVGIEYLLPIFTHAIGEDDMEHMRQTLFASGNLTEPYHSPNTDINKRIRYLAPDTADDAYTNGEHCVDGAEHPALTTITA